MEIGWKATQGENTYNYATVRFYGPTPDEPHRLSLAAWMTWHELKGGGSWRY